MFFCMTLPILLSLIESQAELLQVVGSDAPLIAVAGEDLVLPCVIKPQTNAVDMTVEWYRPDRYDTLVHLYKDHEDTNENQTPTYRGRTSLFKEELLKGNASLKLSDLRVSDEGHYKCLVEDKSRSNEITVYVSVEVQGSHPVITMESYDNSGGIHLMCESRGWNPDPNVLWMNREGNILSGEDTQIHRDTEVFSVKSHITVYDYSDTNRFYCRLQQKHHMMETEIIINGSFFAVGKWIVGILVSACLFAVLMTLISVLLYKKEIQQVKQNADQQRLVMEKEIQQVKQNADQQRLVMEKEIRDLTQNAEQQREKEKDEFKKKRNKFAVDVTLDPDTAHPELILTDGKQVKLGDEQHDVPDTPQRFKYHSVLGREGFCSGRFYYEVQVGMKTEWTLGVVAENIDRKMWFDRNPIHFFWTITLRNNFEYRANACPPVPLTLKEKVQKVGVFVDYEDGLVSFYDVNTSSHIYSFTEQSFTENIYPYFSPRYKEGGKNKEPLIITDIAK